MQLLLNVPITPFTELVNLVTAIANTFAISLLTTIYATGKKIHHSSHR